MTPPRTSRSRCAPYARLVREGVTLLRQINPGGSRNAENCPETADAANDLLNSGTLRPVRSATGVAIFRFPANLRWTSIGSVAGLTQYANRMANCTHVIVEGTRPNPQGVTPQHYFVVLKYGGRVWVADAYSAEFVAGVAAYISVETPGNQMSTFRVASSASYDVVIDDPLADF